MKRLIVVLLMVAVAAELAPAFAEDAFEYDSKSSRNPFVPLISKGGAYVSDAYGISGIKDVRLEGIVWDDAKGSMAIVNGEIVREGQEIGSVKVLKIENGAVVFEVDTEEVRVELSSD